MIIKTFFKVELLPILIMSSFFWSRPIVLSICHKSLYAQLLLHVNREFLETLHAYLLPHGDMHVVLAG